MAETKKKFMVKEYEIMLRPHISEKTIALGQKGVYTFQVHPEANKIQVKLAFFNMYGQMPSKVTISNHMGKTVRSGRTSGTRAAWKKATVSMAKGQLISELNYA
ncbi:MAG: 50S ribosomal protein L23 [Patescibacteria group bacterium]